MSDPQTLQAVIFDLDGVITNTAEYHYQAWRDLAESLGIAFNREFNESLKGLSRMKSLDMILAKSQTQLSDEDRRELAAQKNQHYLKLVADICPKDLLPGVQGFLSQLAQEGIQMVLASASRNAPQIVDNLGVKNYFQAIVDPALLARGKPAPDIFLKAADLIGVKPRDCVGIEDASAGIEAIKAAGMLAVGIGDEKILAQADLVLSSTAQLELSKILTLWNTKNLPSGVDSSSITKKL